MRHTSRGRKHSSGGRRRSGGRKRRSAGQSCPVVHRSKGLPRRTRQRRASTGMKFAFKGKQIGTRPRFPMPDSYHAKLALVGLLRIAGRHGTGAAYKAEARRVLSQVHKLYPGIYKCDRNVLKVKAIYGL